MRSFRADPADSHCTTRIDLVLTSVADEIVGTVASLLAYVGTLALLAILGIALWEQLPDATAMAPSAIAGWSVAERPAPAFAVSQFDSHDKTETYEIFRHPAGGRKDVFRWTDPAKGRIAELEIYRPGGESWEAEPAIADVATRMDPTGVREAEAAGLIQSKFGTVMLLRLIGGANSGRACLGFLKPVEEPNFRISGWSCQGDTLSARRIAISCMLNRLTLLSAGNDPKLAEIFAHAELERAHCASPATPTPSADWVTASDNPQLRGAL
jgi:hypothetical protein